MNRVFTLIALFTAFATFSQNPRLDSIKNVIATSKVDTVLLRSYAVMSDQCPEKDIALYAGKGIELGERTYVDNDLYNKYLGKLYFNKGFFQSISGEKNKGYESYKTSKSYYEKSSNKKGLAITINSIGFYFKELGDFDKSLDYFFQAEKIRTEINDERGLTQSYNDIAFIFSKIGESEKAKEYYFKAVDLGKTSNNMVGLGAAYLNVGHIYFKSEEYDKARSYFLKSLEVKRETGDIRQTIAAINRLGELYQKQKMYDSAFYYYNMGYQSLKETNLANAKAQSSYFLSRHHIELKQYDKAKPFAKSALEQFEKDGILDLARLSAFSLYEIEKAKNNFKPALEYYETYKKYNDSVNKKLNKKELFKKQAKFEYAKQAAADSIENAQAMILKDSELKLEQSENSKNKAEAKSTKILLIFSILGLLMILVFAVVIFKRLKVAKKQKLIIEEQKVQVDVAFEELGEKNKEIMDSINYAKRIQNAILPPKKLVKEYLVDSFIYYVPKDVVAGDFYWMEPTDSGVLFAAADCTGHGVPGAMVSVVCNNGLNRSVREYGLQDPGQILDKTREIVIQEFEKSEDEVKDGMDISMCKIDGNKLSYAGAHNPLWIIRKGSDVVEEIKANKQPIGKFMDPKPYTTHSIELEKGDTIYIFSDGYPDQFGGEKGKKFKSSNFKKLLISIQDLEMSKQKDVINQSFHDWKGSIEQLDDVCVIGFRY